MEVKTKQPQSNVVLDNIIIYPISWSTATNWVNIDWNRNADKGSKMEIKRKLALSQLKCQTKFSTEARLKQIQPYYTYSTT